MNTEPLPPSPRQAEDRPALSRLSDRLTEQIDAAVEEARFSTSGRAVRSDGWTPERVRTFLETLADCGSAGEAAAAAGMTVGGAYAYRRRAIGRPFHMAWLGCMNAARHRLADELMARAIKGNVELIIRDGVVVAERHRHDNALGLAMLKRLDQQQAMLRDEILDARLISDESEEFLDIVCGGDIEEAAGFIVSRRPVPDPVSSREAGLMARLVAYLGRKSEP